MICHIVCMKFRDPTPELLAGIRDDLCALVGVVPELLDMKAGADQLRGDRSFDFALVARFADMEALERYRVHPAHRRVAERIAQVRERSVSVDFPL